MQSVTVSDAIRGLFVPEFTTAANKAAIARSWNYYGAGAQNADVYHVVCTIAILGYRADLAALWER